MHSSISKFPGDIFDEGEFSSEKEFNQYVKRFHKTFHLPHHTPMYITVGNHDIGFHNKYVNVFLIYHYLIVCMKCTFRI